MRQNFCVIPGSSSSMLRRLKDLLITGIDRLSKSEVMTKVRLPKGDIALLMDRIELPELQSGFVGLEEDMLLASEEADYRQKVQRIFGEGNVRIGRYLRGFFKNPSRRA